MFATRPECPKVVGSRCSIACTAAFTNPSNSRSISSYSRLFSMATAACPASAVTSSTVRLEYGTTWWYVPRRGEHGVGLALAVDELEDADHFFLVILHGDDEHRLRAVAVPLVERAVDAVFDIRRQEVGIVDHERLAGHRRVPRETRAVHRDRELDERRVGLGVRLRDPEAQPLLALVARLDEVETARVRGGDPSRLREDELEQGFQVPLGAEGDADARQLADLAAAVRGFGSGAGGLHAGGGFPIPRPYRDEQLPRPDRLLHEAGEQLRRHLRG